jgi:hypothetical protein
LEPAQISVPVYDKNGKLIPEAPGCQTFDYQHPYRHPIKMDQFLILALDLGDFPRDRIRYLTFNVTFQPGQTIAPEAMRPSMAAATSSQTNLGNRVYFLMWNQPIAGDVIPTFSLSLTYTPVAAGLPWTAQTFYPAGSAVVPPVPNGHFYTTIAGGISASAPPNFPVETIGQTSEVGGYGLSWTDRGAPIPAGLTAWAQSTAYALNSLVTPVPANGHYYQAATPGVSGLQAPPWPINGSTVTESGGVIWLDSGSAQPASAKVKAWSAYTPYFLGDVVLDPRSGHYLTAASQGISGPNLPTFNITQVPSLAGQVTETPDPITINDNQVTWKLLSVDTDAATITAQCSTVLDYKANTTYAFHDCIMIGGRFYLQMNNAPGLSYVPPNPAPTFPLPSTMTISWLDLGATAPASVASGQPSDQTSTFNYTLTQSHSLSRFNLSSGVIVSSIKNTSYVYTTAPTATSPGVIKQLNGGPIVDPVLFLTAYIFGKMDAERPWRTKDLKPGVSLGFSLTSPASNFYFGGSSEFFLRNLQIVYGFSLAKTSTLSPPGTVQASTVTTPPTYQTFSKGGFVGLSFNVSGFIQSLF